MTVVRHPKVATLASFGDYSPVAEAGDGELIAIAGQFGTDSTGGWPDGDGAEAQVRGAFRNFGNALDEVGLSWEHVLKFNTFLLGRETVEVFMRVRKEVFAEIFPASVYPPNTLLLVAGLVEEGLVCEIEGLAVRPVLS